LYTVPATAPEKLTAAVDELTQTAWLLTLFTVGVGFTVMVNVVGVPLQVVPPLVYVGVTVTVAVIAVEPPFVAVKDVILPAPLAASPIAVLLFVQL
jgi:hypothetical protein